MLPKKKVLVVMDDVRQEKLQWLSQAIIGTPGETEATLRSTVASYPNLLANEQELPPLPDVVRAYVEKVSRHAYKVTDEDIQGLRDAGYSDNAIFELTVSCALGAGMFRFERGLTLMMDERS